MGIKQRRVRRDAARADDPESMGVRSIDDRIRSLSYDNAVRHQVLRDSLASMSPVVLVLTLFLAYKAESFALIAFQLANALVVALTATLARGRASTAVAVSTVSAALFVTAAWVYLRGATGATVATYPVGTMYFVVSAVSSTLVSWMERRQEAKLRTD